MAAGRVNIMADVRNEGIDPASGPPGVDAAKARLLVGEPVGTAPGEGSVLDTLKGRLEVRLKAQVRVELLKEKPEIRGIRAQKGQIAYTAELLPPVPEGMPVKRFHAAVRSELDEIRKELEPKIPPRRPGKGPGGDGRGEGDGHERTGGRGL